MADDEEANIETLKIIDPETSQRLGPALGMQPKSKWILKKVPKGMRQQQIQEALFAKTPTWPGWRVMVTGPPKQGSTKQLINLTVMSQDPPPNAMLIINGTKVTMLCRSASRRRCAPVLIFYAYLSGRGPLLSGLR